MRYNTGLAFGGNEVRQLEFHLGAAQARDADTVLVTGAAHPPGYGRLNDAVREAMAMAARQGCCSTRCTPARRWPACSRMCVWGRIAAGSRVLFIHTSVALGHVLGRGVVDQPLGETGQQHQLVEGNPKSFSDNA